MGEFRREWLPWLIGAITLGGAGVCFEVYVHPFAGVIGAIGVLVGAVIGQRVGEHIDDRRGGTP